VAKVTMPQLGESVAEGTIGKWLKQLGDPVALDEPLLEVITDKVNAEVPSPFEGILRKILVEEGQTVPYMAEIAEIEEVAGATPRGSGTAAAKSAAPPAQPATPPAQAAESSPAAQPGAPATTGATAGATPLAGGSATPLAGGSATPLAGGSATPLAGGSATPLAGGSATPADRPAMVPVMAVGDPDARMTPAVRMLMREHGLGPVQIAGTGHAGRITREDVLAFVATAGDQPAVSPNAQPAPVLGVASHSPGLAPAAPSAAPSAVWEPGQDEVLVPHTQMRKGIAAQMTRAAQIPVAHSTFEADMTAVVKLRGQLADAYKAREGVGLSFLPFVVKAVVEALHGHPDINAHYVEEGLLRKRRINVGIAIAVDNGLIVPVIHDADQLSINGINRAIQDLAARARSNKLRLDDLQGGTFTVDNTGWFGSILTVPIINPPEVCILTTEAVVKRPVVRETPEGDVLAVRSMMNLVAGYDHRATDGAQIGKFVRDVICWLEAVGPDSAIY
jgi:pyruvate/2-oxoglutarate dehydrogenase complex dihydrolipoamide acyltransferase (E2) component